MNNNQLQTNDNYTNEMFESIKHVDENGIEFWYARELQKVLNYTEWRKFEKVIVKAKISCKNTGISVFEHFVGADKMVQIGSGAKRKQQDYKLTRYACYLIAQNGDSRKNVIAQAQTYFAIKTRLREINKIVWFFDGLPIHSTVYANSPQWFSCLCGRVMCILMIFKKKNEMDA